MTPAEVSYETVRTFAKRIEGYAESILEAHQLGHGPGDTEQLWTRQYQEKAVHIYALTLPWSYQIELANQFNATARFMINNGSPGQATGDWIIVVEYLRTAAETTYAYAPETTRPASRTHIGGKTPGALRFELLAEIASTAGAQELRDAGRSVQATLDRAPEPFRLRSPLSIEEVAILRRLAAGERIADISSHLGYSERSLYRRLNDIWTRLGVSNRAEGITIAVSNGWLPNESGDGSQPAAAE